MSKINPIFKTGDVVVRSNWPEDGRIIFHVSEDCYYYADYNFVSKQFMYKPTNAAAGITTMDQKFHKCGTLKNFGKFIKGLSEVMNEHNKAFALSEKLFKGNIEIKYTV